MKAHAQLAVILGALLSADMATASVVGLVLDVNGAAKAQVAGHAKALDIAAPVDSGTRIDLATGSEISFVYYPTRQQISLRGPAALQVLERSLKQLQGEAMRVSNLPQNRSAAALGFQSQVVPAAMVIRVPPTELVPIEPWDGETVLPQRPLFAWASSANEPFDFALMQDGQMLHQQRVEGNRLELPLGLALDSGHAYRWQITSAKSDKAAAQWSRFTVADAGLRMQMQNDLPAPDAGVAQWALYALELEQHQMHSQASQVWKQLAKQRPNSSKLKQLAR